MIHPWIALFVSHLAGDFLLQPGSWIHHKSRYGAKSAYLYLHAIIHGLLFWLLMGLPKTTPELMAVGVLVVSHFFIDWWKISRSNSHMGFRYFAVDQAAHGVVLFGIALSLDGNLFSITNMNWNDLVLMIGSIIGVTTASSHTIQALMRRWNLPEGNPGDSLKDAGKFIGYIERFLVFFFVIKGIWTAVGFLLAAKSVFRFSDLSRAKDRKLTEYILIGTLTSFGLGIAWGVVFLWLSKI